jgi:hypothetical protein
MYRAQRIFFRQITDIIEQIVAQTDRLRFPTAKIQFQRAPVPHIIPPAKSANARKKRMAARSGQRGCVIRKGRYWVVRFRIDVAGQFERKLRSVRLCPVEGEGALSKIERHRKALEVIATEEANSEDKFHETESSSITFREQSRIWLTTVSNRRRKPIKPHTLTSWRSHLVWLNSKITDTPLSAINNGVMRNLVTEMHEAGFKPKTMLNYLASPGDRSMNRPFGCRQRR